MTLYLEDPVGTFTAWLGAPIRDVRRPLNIEQLWTAEELADVDLYIPAEPDIPNGKISTGRTVGRVDGIVTFIDTLRDVTPADYPLTMRQLRLGLLGAGYPVIYIQTVIDAIQDTAQRGAAQIWYDETSVVEWDHPMTQALIAAAGISDEAATAMWLGAKDLAA